MSIEYELKFRAKEEILAKIAADYSQYPAKHFQMETTYYDTPSGALSARHYTLRCRKENDHCVCTLKTPAAGIGRNEFELACNHIEDAIPALCASGAPEIFAQLVKEGVIAVCGAKFHRTAITVQSESCTLELALDCGTLSGGGHTIPLCEAEVELKAGDPKSADLFATMLSAEYDLVQESHSKFLRALALCRKESL